MVRKIIFSSLLMLLLLSCIGCSRRIFEAMEPHKFQDNWFVLRKNGHYSFKLLLLGAFRIPDTQRGRYIRSNDTVYLVSKKGKDLMEYYAIGIIDSAARTFRLRYVDSTEWKIMEIGQMPTRKNDRLAKKK